MVVHIREAVRLLMLHLKRLIDVGLLGMDISRSARVSWGARLDKTYPKGIHIGDESYVASGALILTHDYCRGLKTDTVIGKRCFIGANAIIMPGVLIEDSVVVGAGAVVVKNVPSHCIVAGNPAQIIKNDIKTGKYGKIIEP